MRVEVPFAGTPHPEVDAALMEACGFGAYDRDWWNVGVSDRAYFDALSGWWARGETFCIVEHDIVVHPDAITGLANCPHDWCSYPYEYEGGMTHGLGCVKFSADLLLRRPLAMTRVGVMFDERHPKRHWCRLDAWLTSVLQCDGERRHEHVAPVRHLRTSHSCLTH